MKINSQWEINQVQNIYGSSVARKVMPKHLFDTPLMEFVMYVGDHLKTK